VARTETTRTTEFTAGCVSSGVVRIESVAVFGPYVTTALRHLLVLTMAGAFFSSYIFDYIGYPNKCGGQLNFP